MTPHDNHLHDQKADADAAYDMALEDARKSVVITGYEFGECLLAKSDIKMDLFFQAVVESDCPVMKAMVQTICADVISRKAKQAMGMKK